MLRSDLGKPGQAVLERLRKLSVTPGQDALKAQFAQLNNPIDLGQDPEAQRLALKQILPVMQAAAEGGKAVAVAPGQPDALRDAVLQLADRGELKDWLEGCKAVLSDGRPGCVLVEGRFLLEPAATTIDRLLDGDFSLKPAPLQVLDIGARQIGLRP